MLKLRRLGLLVPCVLSMLACTAPSDDIGEDESNITDAELKGKDFIHKGTYPPGTTGGFARNSVELEETNTIKCVDGAEMLKLLRATRGGRTTYDRLKKSDTSEAFTSGYAIDEMTWDSSSHKLREKNPLVWLTIESGRYEIDPKSGERELSLGTDINDDTYYDTKDFKLLKQSMILRGRARWDTPTEIRRILVGAKFGIEVDPFGIKSSGKVDERNDGASAAEIASMDKDIRRGFVAWGSPDHALAPVREVYERLSKEARTLPDTRTLKDVLLLEPKANLRAVRSRFHLDETPIDSVEDLAKNGETKIDAVLAMIAAERPRGFAANEAVIAAFEAKVKAVRDGSLLATRAATKLKALDAAQGTTAADIKKLTEARIDSPLASDKRKVIAEAKSALLHELAADLDGIRRFIARAEDRTFENEPDMVRAWLKSADRPAIATLKATLGPLKTFDAFVPAWTKLVGLADAKRAEELAAYNEFGKAQKAAGNKTFKDFVARADADLKPIGAQLANEEVRIWQRQIETAGSAAIGLWFDASRAFYVPNSFRVTFNFLIDTLDQTDMYDQASWESIPAVERTAAKVLPAEKAFHSMVSNDVQIELGMEKPYMDRLAELTAQPASPERDKLLAGAKFVFGSYRDVMHQVGTIKGEGIIDELKKAGGPSCMKWDAVEQSKGETALTMVRAKK